MVSSGRRGAVDLLVALRRDVGEVVGLLVNDDRRLGAREQILGGEGVGGRHQLGGAVLAHLQRRQVAAGRMPAVAWHLEMPTGGVEVARLAAGRCDRAGFALAHRVDVQPVEARRELTGAVVFTVTVAKPPENAKSAVATVAPLAFLSWAVSLSPAGGASPWLSPADADGAGEPVQTDGVVPGCRASASRGTACAPSRRAGTANRAAELDGLNMPRAYPVTATITPGGCSASSGDLGSTGAASSLPTSSAASRSPGASLK